MTTSWRVQPHGPLIQLEEHLWIVDGTLDMLPIGRRMTIARLSDGGLLLHSVVCCDEPTMAAIDALGPVRFIVVPSAYHRIDAPRYKQRYPRAQVLATAQARAQVTKLVAVDGDYALLPQDSRLGYELLAGLVMEGVFIVRSAAGAVTLVFNDALMNLPDSLPGFRGWLTGLIGSTGGPKVTRTAKLGLVRDRYAYADHLRRLSALPGLARIVMSHGAVIDRDAAAILRRVADGVAPARS